MILDKEQEAILNLTTGSHLLLAGPGSGKTRVLTSFMDNKIKDIPANRILALTFTQKAAGEMVERLKSMGHTKLPYCRTFHSFALQFLKNEGWRMGMEDIKIATETQITNALNQAKREVLSYRTGAKAFSGAFPLELLKEYISSMHNSEIPPLMPENDPEGLLKDLFLDGGEFTKVCHEIYVSFSHKLQKMGVFQFEELILNMNYLLRNDPEVKSTWSEFFQIVLVDEYQDVNLLQINLLKLLSHENSTFLAVADLDQSIYGFRYSTPDSVLDFNTHFPGGIVHHLTKNYRSTSPIIELATDLISKNIYRVPVTYTSVRGKGILPCAMEYDTEEAEAMAIAETLALWKETAYLDLKGVAILVRTHAQSLPILRACRSLNVPVAGGLDSKFFKKMEVVQFQSILEVLLAGQEEELKKLIYRGFYPVEDFLPGDHETFGEWARRCLETSGYKGYIEETWDEAPGRLENLNALVSQMQGVLNYDHWQIYLQGVLDSNPRDEENGVTVATLHSAKGLEFPVVFLPGLEEDILPHFRSTDHLRSIEEERRLLYVGMTRASDRLYLSWARNRQDKLQSPSRFWLDLPGEKINFLKPSRQPGAQLTHKTKGTALLVDIEDARLIVTYNNKDLIAYQL